MTLLVRRASAKHFKAGPPKLLLRTSFRHSMLLTPSRALASSNAQNSSSRPKTLWTENMRSGVLDHDLSYGIARVAAPIDHFFQQLVQVFKRQHFSRIEVAVVELPQDIQNQLICLPLHLLEHIIHFLDLLDAGAALQLLDHLYHLFGCNLQDLDVVREIGVFNHVQADNEAFGDFLDGLRNLIQDRTQQLDVLAINVCDRVIDDRLVDLFRDLLFRL